MFCVLCDTFLRALEFSTLNFSSFFLFFFISIDKVIEDQSINQSITRIIESNQSIESIRLNETTIDSIDSIDSINSSINQQKDYVLVVPDIASIRTRIHIHIFTCRRYK
jgi:hypothetical protein